METVNRETVTMTPPTEGIPLVRTGLAASVFDLPVYSQTFIFDFKTQIRVFLASVKLLYALIISMLLQYDAGAGADFCPSL